MYPANENIFEKSGMEIGNGDYKKRSLKLRTFHSFKLLATHPATGNRNVELKD
jgi:hypothetical protein